jgi:RNA recognition motif-containing protein
MKSNKGSSRVFVANLSCDATSEEIRSLFAVASQRPVVIAADRTRGAVRSAILEFPRPESAAAAVRMYDGIEFAGRRLRLSARRRPSERT